MRINKWNKWFFKVELIKGIRLAQNPKWLLVSGWFEHIRVMFEQDITTWKNVVQTLDFESLVCWITFTTDIWSGIMMNPIFCKRPMNRINIKMLKNRNKWRIAQKVVKDETIRNCVRIFWRRDQWDHYIPNFYYKKILNCNHVVGISHNLIIYAGFGDN